MNNESAEERFKLEGRLSRIAAWEFVQHVVVGAIIFLTVLAVAAGLYFIGAWLQALCHLPEGAIGVLNAFELMLIFVDTLLGVVYMFQTGYIFMRSLFSHDARRS